MNDMKEMLNGFMKIKEKPEDYENRLNKMHTVSEIRAAYDSNRLNSEREAMAMKIWQKLSMAEVEKAETIAELNKAAIESPAGSEAEEAAQAKMQILYQKHRDKKDLKKKSSNLGPDEGSLWNMIRE